MLFYERLSKERRDGEREDTFCEEESDEIPNVKVELTKDLADVSILIMRLCSLTLTEKGKRCTILGCADSVI